MDLRLGQGAQPLPVGTPKDMTAVLSVGTRGGALAHPGKLPSKANSPDRLARARSLAALQEVRQDRLVGQSADRRRGLHAITGGEVQLGEGAWNVEADHAMGVPAELGALQREVAPGSAGIEGVAMRGCRLLGARRVHQRVGGHDDEGAGTLGPALVEFDQQAEELVPMR